MACRRKSKGLTVFRDKGVEMVLAGRRGCAAARDDTLALLLLGVRDVALAVAMGRTTLTRGSSAQPAPIRRRRNSETSPQRTRAAPTAAQGLSAAAPRWRRPAPRCRAPTDRRLALGWRVRRLLEPTRVRRNHRAARRWPPSRRWRAAGHRRDCCGGCARRRGPRNHVRTVCGVTCRSASSLSVGLMWLRSRLLR